MTYNRNGTIKSVGPGLFVPFSLTVTEVPDPFRMTDRSIGATDDFSHPTEITMKSTFAILTLLGLAACNADTPTGTDSSVGAPLLARGGGNQTLYAITLAGGLQSDPTRPFSALGVTGNPFSAKVSADPVYLVLPASAGGDNLAVCDGDGSLGPSTGSWGAYAGVWKGSFSVTGKMTGNGYHVAFGAKREDGTGFLWLVVNATAVKSNNNLTLTFTNVRGLLNVSSTPVGGGPADPQDRCLTFSITATP